ncbi:MAG: radical SAM protein [Candidatus Omnitrophica bacterium]|nr:radical SAM protein [Candidatus Omnitrophota bacterium]
MRYIWKIDGDHAKWKLFLARLSSGDTVSFNIDALIPMSASCRKRFRGRFWRLLADLRRRGIGVDLDALRLESIKCKYLLLGPKTLHLEIISLCNYHCRFCRTHSCFKPSVVARGRRHFLSFAAIKKIVRQACARGTDSIQISGLGEPLLHPHIVDLVRWLLRADLNVRVFTNGAVPDVVARLLKIAPNPQLTFHLNLAAADPQKFAQVHGVAAANFNGVLQSAMKLQRRFNVLLNFIIYKDNVDDMEAFLELAGHLKFKRVRFKFPFVLSKDQESISCSKRQVDSVLGRLDGIKHQARVLGVDVDVEMLTAFAAQVAGRVHLKRCYYGWFFAMVNLQGGLFNCCRTFSPVAKLAGSGFSAAFFSAEFQRVVAKGAEGVDPHRAPWQHCDLCLVLRKNMLIDSKMRAMGFPNED